MSSPDTMFGENLKKRLLHFGTLKVKAQEVPDLTAIVESGTFWYHSGHTHTLIKFSGDVTDIFNIPIEYPKWYIVAVSFYETQEVVILEGYESEDPQLPYIPDQRFPVAAVYLTPETTAITNDIIYDIRPIFQLTEGMIGDPGTDGTSGISGSSGTSGSSGIDGIPGIDGTSGTSGESGSSGTSTNDTRYIEITLVSDDTEIPVKYNITGDFECPMSGNIVDVGAYITGPDTGIDGIMVVDILLNGISIMEVDKIRVMSGEKSSRTSPYPPVLTTTSIIAGDILNFSILNIHTTPAKGVSVWLKIQEHFYSNGTSHNDIVNASTIEIFDPTSTVNTVEKYAGKMVFDTTQNRPCWASGSEPNSFWYYTIINSTEIELTNINSQINQMKYDGMMIWDMTYSRVLWCSSYLPAGAWKDALGDIIYTPS